MYTDFSVVYCRNQNTGYFTNPSFYTQIHTCAYNTLLLQWLWKLWKWSSLKARYYIYHFDLYFLLSFCKVTFNCLSDIWYFVKGPWGNFCVQEAQDSFNMKTTCICTCSSHKLLKCLTLNRGDKNEWVS